MTTNLATNTMPFIENLYDKDQLIAQVADFNTPQKTEFCTPDECTMQLAFHTSISKKVFAPHIHKILERNINRTAEFIFVLEGTLEIDVLSESHEVIERIRLTNNMALLQFFGGHSITSSPNTRFFELKQGPYFGRDSDKYILED